MFQFLRLSTKFLAVLRLSVNPTETLNLAKVWPSCRYLIKCTIKCVNHLAPAHDLCNLFAPRIPNYYFRNAKNVPKTKN